MAQRRAHKKNLSKGILDMKFMKKSKEKFERDIQDKESSDWFGNSTAKAANCDGDQFIIEHSMVPIEKLLSGRMSFKGMNPEVERLMEQERREIVDREKAMDRIKSNQPEISDSKMAYHLGKSIAKKFNVKNGNNVSDDSDNSDNSESGSEEEPEESPQKKTKFMKPVDD